MMVTLAFTMQAAGLVFGPLLAAALLWTHLSPDIIWRLLLAFGAIPAISVFWMRRHMAETPRYLLATGQHDAFGEAASHILGQMEGGERRSLPVADRPVRVKEGDVDVCVEILERHAGRGEEGHHKEVRLLSKDGRPVHAGRGGGA